MPAVRLIPLFLFFLAAVTAPPALAQNEPMGAGSFSGMDAETMAVTQMMEAEQDTQDDTRDLLREMNEKNKQKKAQRNAGSKMKDEKKKPQGQKPPAGGDSLGDLGGHQQDKMKAQQDRMEKADSAASEAMKKSSDTQSGIVGNLK